MKVLFLSTAPDLPGLARPRLLRGALRAAGIEVLDRWCPSRRGGGSRAGALAGGGGALREALASGLALARCAARCLAGPGDAEAVLVPYGGTLDPWIARALARRGRALPVIVDAFLSLREAAVEDRGIARAGSATDRLLSALDRLAVRSADLLLVDTQETGRLFVERYGARPDRVLEVPVGSDLVPSPPRVEPGRLRVLFAGTGIPFHGVAHILAAFRRLEGEAPGIVLRFVGGTPGDREAAAGLRNVRLEPGPVGREELARAHAESDLVLGVFGAGPKADRVVPCKVYDALAAGRALATGASAAVGRLLAGVAGVAFVPRSDPDALATALLRLLREPERVARMGEANAAAFATRFAAPALGERLRAAIEALRPTRACAAFPVRTAPT